MLGNCYSGKNGSTWTVRRAITVQNNGTSSLMLQKGEDDVTEYFYFE